MCKEGRKPNKIKKYKGGIEMKALAFNEFMANNRAVLYAAAESNTPKNVKGIPCIRKDDEWAKEVEWDTQYKDVKRTKE